MRPCSLSGRRRSHIYGILLAITGLLYFINLVQIPNLPIRGIQIFLSLLFIASGILMVLMPMKGLMAFTLIIVCAFIVQGITQFIACINHTQNRSWLLVNAIIGIVAGVLILSEWPTSAN